MGDIPADMLKVTLDKHLSLITKIINLSFENGCFPDNLKLVEDGAIFKKNDYLGKENSTRVSVFFNNSKWRENTWDYHDNKLTFKSHVKILCRKAFHKIGALSSLLSHLID